MKNNGTHRMERTAKEEYEILQADCKNLMKMIAELLEKNALKEKGNIHWGHVGNLQHTKSQLKETLACYFYDTERREEEVLDEIEAKLRKMTDK